MLSFILAIQIEGLIGQRDKFLLMCKKVLSYTISMEIDCPFPLLKKRLSPSPLAK